MWIDQHCSHIDMRDGPWKIVKWFEGNPLKIPFVCIDRDL